MNIKPQYFAEYFRNDYYTIEVTFNDTDPSYPSYQKAYTYKVPKVTQLAPGDKVVVFVKSQRNGDQLKIVTVKAVHAAREIHKNSGFDYKWIVGRRDAIFQNYDANVERDNKLKVAVTKLQAAVDSVAMKKQITEAMGLLDADTVAELKQAFGEDFAAIEA